MIPSGPHTIHLARAASVFAHTRPRDLVAIDQKELHSCIEHNGCVKITDTEGKLLAILSPGLWTHITPATP